MPEIAHNTTHTHTQTLSERMRRLKKQIGKQTNQIYTPLGVRICICMCVFTYDRQSELNESTIDEIYNAGRIFFKVRVTLPIAYHLRIQAK